MKKLMTSTIILLPLLILAIMLVSGAIMSLLTHIYVEEVEFVESGTLVLVMDDEAAPPTEQLEVNVLPLKAENRGLVYTVDDRSVVSVDANGVVTAQYFGETYITVTSAENKAAVDKRRVLVTDSSVHKIVLNEGYKTDLYEGGQEDRTETLSVTVYPKEAENKSVVWKSSNEEVLHVSANGTVTLRGAGTATVTATSSDNPEAFDSVEITCHKRIESVETERTRVFTALSEAQFPAVTGNPADADITLSYRSGDPAVAEVDDTGRITFLKPGRVTITAIATDFGKKTAEVSKEYVSTLGYYSAPLFETKQFTVDYDAYKNANEALPIPFAPTLAEAYRKVTNITYSVNGVLEFDEGREEFRFADGDGMPAGVKTLTATVTARGYDTTTNELVDLVDSFSLTVLRKAQSVSVAYKGTHDANSIVLSGNSLTFGAQRAAAIVNVFPANHTDTVRYTLEGDKSIASLSGSTLTFKKAGTVTVNISCFDEEGSETAKKSITVSYAPVAEDEHQKGVEITEPEPGQAPEEEHVSLSVHGEEKEEALVYFTEPAGTKVSYEVTEGKGDVVTLKKENGVYHIVPVNGGFATVEITVTEEVSAPAGVALLAARAGETSAVYIIEVYVDWPVSADGIKVTLGGELCADVFDTKLGEVPFTVEAESPNGELEGKRLYAAYGTQRAAAEEDGLLRFTGSISFGKENSTLTVTFGAEYGERAVSCGAAGGLVSVTRTLRRNADSIKVFYQNIEVQTVPTTSKTLTFTTDEAPAVNRANVRIEPATYTETISYSLASGDESKATLALGVLSFKDAQAACSVQVKISLTTADGTVTLSAEITVSYTPRNSEDKIVSFPQDDGKTIVLLMSDVTDKAKISYILPAGSALECKADTDAVTIGEENGEKTIVPAKGGFATVTLTETAEDGSIKTYTVKVYVDRPVRQEDFEVTFGEGDAAPVGQGEVFGTKLGKVPFKVTMKCAEDVMQGKLLYVRYGAQQTVVKAEEAGGTEFTGEIVFDKSLGTLLVTFGVEYTEEALSYGAAEGLEWVTRTLARNAETVSVEYGGAETYKIVFGSKSAASGGNSLTVGEKNADITVSVAPAAHTDVLTYSLKEGAEGIAALDERGKLTFQSAGTVTVVLKVMRGETVSVEREFEVTYAPVGANVAVELGESASYKRVTLPFEGEGNSKNKDGVIYFSEPAEKNVSYRVQRNADAVALQIIDGVYHIVPKKGGFATVEISAGNAVYTVEVYVDKSVSVEDFTVQFNGTLCEPNGSFRTSLESVVYALEVADREGSLAGKTVYIAFGGEEVDLEEGVHNKTDTALFGAATNLTFTFGVKYTEDAAACGASGSLVSTERRAETSKGNLDKAPTVTYQSGEEQKALSADAENIIVLEDVGEQIVFTVSGPFLPADFVLEAGKVKVEGGGTAFTAEISADGGTVTLISKTYADGQAITLTVGGQTLRLKVTVHAKAQTVSVGFGGKSLDEDMKYKTLLNALTFTVTLGREDGAPIYNKDIEWSLDERDWKQVPSSSEIVSVPVTGLEDGENFIHFRPRNGAEGAEFTLSISRVNVESFNLDLSVMSSAGVEQKLNESPIEVKETPTSNEFSLSADMQGTITITVSVAEDLLGGVGTDEQFKALFEVNLSSAKWGLEYDGESGHIILSEIPVAFTHEIYLAANGRQATLKFTRFRLDQISFIDFDSKTDNYRGYQQVRVFAKQSTYDGTDVDYFRMKIAPIGDAASKAPFDPTAFPMLSWEFKSFNDTSGTDSTGTPVASQKNDKVTYGEKTYRIVEKDSGYELQDESGNTVVKDGKYQSGQPRVAWIDAHSEAAEGYVRIYFGEFRGLSETDVQNDYFGNFGEQANWEPPTEAERIGITGSPVAPSAGAFSYLRLTGGDGAQNGVNCHFNFNILEGADLYNVEDATSYYKKSKVVLHENLYGEGELGTEGAEFDKATAKDLFLTQTNATWNSTDSTMLGKTTVYGNGYQISLQAKNEQLIAGDPNNRNNSWGVSFGNLYNVFVKGANPEETVNVLRQKIVLIFTNAYYCDLQGYTKGRPQNNQTAYIKNTVLHAASQSGFQLFYTREQAYFENVTVVDCAAGITNENSQAAADHETNFYFKGNLDVLNYNNLPSLLKMASASESLAGMLGALLGNEPWTNFESFGKKCLDPTNKAYVNLVIYTSNTKGKFNFWNGNSYDLNKKESVVGDNVPMKEILDLTPYKSHLGGSEVTAWTFDYPRNRKYREPGKTYDYSISVDGRSFSSSTGTQYFQFMFTEERYIRLLCQYVNFSQDGTNLVKNDEHILWHMQQAYRDKSLLTDRKNDHMEALRESLTGKNITWPDGTTPEEAMQVYDSYQATLAAQMTALLSETVLPDKRSY